MEDTLISFAATRSLSLDMWRVRLMMKYFSSVNYAFDGSSTAYTVLAASPNSRASIVMSGNWEAVAFE